MTTEDKELLLKDLSARLPYGIKGIIIYDDNKNIFTIKGIFNILFLSDTECCHIEDFKPYLRPMSSMTEEEEREFLEIIGYKEKDENGWIRCDNIYTEWGLNLNGCNKLVSWLDENHFDHRTDEEGKTLIEKGLAIEVTEENNPYKD